MNRILLSTLVSIVFLLLAIAPATAQEGPDEWEPNDEMDLADTIGEMVIEGEIGRRGDDDDWFVLDGQEGIYPRITLWYDDTDCDIDLEVFSDDELVGSLTGVSSPDTDTFHVPGVCYIHVYAYEGTGSYTVEIENTDDERDHRDRPRDTDHRRPGQCEGPDEIESNDTMRRADLIEGFEIEGYACVDDDDWFVLNGQEGYYPIITLYYDDVECDIDLEVYSEDEEVGFLGSIESPDSDQFDVPDVCYLHVYAYEGEGDYRIEIEPTDDTAAGDCQGADEWESNDDMDLADVITGFTIDGYCCENDHDWFVLDGQEGRHPTITIYYETDDCDIDVEVWSGDDLAGTLESVRSPDWDDFRIRDVCYLHVYAYDGEGAYFIEIEP